MVIESGHQKKMNFFNGIFDAIFNYEEYTSENYLYEAVFSWTILFSILSENRGL